MKRSGVKMHIKLIISFSLFSIKLLFVKHLFTHICFEFVVYALIEIGIFYARAKFLVVVCLFVCVTIAYSEEEKKNIRDVHSIRGSRSTGIVGCTTIFTFHHIVLLCAI